MPSPTKSELNNYQQEQLSQVKYLNEMAEAYQNRTKSKALRKENLEKQKRRTYHSEYERLRGHVENSATLALTRDHLKTRTDRLNTLVARAVDSIE